MPIIDPGGTITIHLFAGFFGWAVAFLMRPNKIAKNNPNFRPSYGSVSMTLLGTFFIWIYFPSLNSALMLNSLRFLASINTVFALLTSTISTFILSAALRRNKFRWENIAYATVTGGVMIGWCWSIITTPYIAMLIGLIAGIWSTLSFEYLFPIFPRCKLFETRGIVHMHLMPAGIGVLISYILILLTTSTTMKNPNF